MANHAKIFTEKKIDPKVVDSIVREINETKFKGVFNLEYMKDYPNGWSDHQWVLRYKDDPYLGLEFWISENNIESDNNCVEFRHGHTFKFMWYVEGVLREAIKDYYNGTYFDDGSGWQNDEETYFDSFESYCKRDIKDDEVIEKRKYIYFGIDKKDIPQEITDKLELNFNI